MTQRTSFYPVRGGLDLITPAVEVAPGRAIAGSNYEPLERGYGRILGYERVDGRTKASQALYYVLGFDAGVRVVVEGNVVEGVTSGATGVALVDAQIDSGSIGAGTAVGRLVLGGVNGTFIDDEALRLLVGGQAVGTCDGTLQLEGADDDDEDAAWSLAASERARALIEAVPGSGPIRGVFQFDNSIWAIRDNAGATAAVLYRSSVAGWVAEPADMGANFWFDAGTAEFAEGETLTGGTSGATATIRRVIVTSGTWGGSDAVGRLIISTPTGTFQDNETITSASGSATADGVVLPFGLPAGGRYEFDSYNFAGLADRRAMYFTGGVQRAMEYRDGVVVPLHTGLSDALDKPTHIIAHRNHLFAAFRGGSLQFSAIGDPYSWTVVQGAGEIGLGEDVTGLLSVVDGVLVVTGATRIAVLYGTSSADFRLDLLADDSGAAPYSMQRIGAPLYLDDRGVRSIEQTEAFGNFVRGTMTRMIDPLMRAWLATQGRTPVASFRIRAKDQYRLIWDDGTGMIIYLGRDVPEVMKIDLDGMVPTCAASTKDGEAREIVLFGAADGFVYEMESGVSFDGEPIKAFARLPFNHVGNPTQQKRWHKATLEIDAPPSLDLKVCSEVSYGNPDEPGGIEQAFAVSGGGGFWDEIDWDDFYWSTQAEGQAEVYIDRIGTNLSLVFFSQSAVEPVHTVHGLTLHYTYRRLKR